MHLCASQEDLTPKPKLLSPKDVFGLTKQLCACNISLSEKGSAKAKPLSQLYVGAGPGIQNSLGGLGRLHGQRVDIFYL